MGLYVYKKQSILNGFIFGSSSDRVFALGIDGVNANKLTSYEIKAILEDETSGERSVAYYRGNAINDRGITPVSYAGYVDTSFVYNTNTSNCLYIITTPSNVYNRLDQAFYIFLENSNPSNLDYKITVSVEICFIDP